VQVNVVASALRAEPVQLTNGVLVLLLLLLVKSPTAVTAPPAAVVVVAVVVATAATITSAVARAKPLQQPLAATETALHGVQSSQMVLLVLYLQLAELQLYQLTPVAAATAIREAPETVIETVRAATATAIAMIVLVLIAGVSVV
jgi:hypothetical protein